ncbi:MAG: fumarate hydratase C-terminal domain-containing protein [Deltaproteobacteria bacterium]|nr:fumarate hydratase C-terminal domain-containing protein [Deltaproteobacteria bacterium]
MISINLPATEDEIRALNIGDEVGISGVMITARDAAHKYLVEFDAPEVKEYLRNGMIYHCGPIVRQVDGQWQFVAAGPTTSKREEPYEADVIARYGVRGVIGKGGMGERTLAACREYGAVYLHAIGGLAVILARSVKRVREVHKLDEFGAPEAMWVIEVDNFPAVVTMDSHGKSIHAEVLEKSAKLVARLSESG